MFIDEICIWAKLESGYIVKFIGASWSRPINMECVLEYMDLGDLHTYLSKHSHDEFDWEQMRQSIYSILNGLIYLHTNYSSRSQVT
ncbi:hypothetical protein THRCLA_23219 [Thraustotheca clavata]|uniref:Protein kinase domain-containing protein n=1 Tax=Thraustotheca clavata TaxID=74557 RepID=A0A1V9Y988_9STRA|nr:hypothetical protein THRCLA_23219 [Thraustotheca clavata]